MALPTLYSLISIPRLEIVEIVAGAGFDGVLIDMEHGPISVSDLPALVAAAAGAGCECLVRVGEDLQSVGVALDCGATGIVFPHVHDVRGAEEAVDATRFSGSRSLNPFIRAARYGANGAYAREADRQIKVFCIIEGEEGLSNASEIAKVDGVNAIFIGPYDLSVALGHPGEVMHPVVVAAVEAVISACRHEGRSTAVFASEPSAGRMWSEKGVESIFLGVDADVLRTSYVRLASHFASNGRGLGTRDIAGPGEFT